MHSLSSLTEVYNSKSMKIGWVHNNFVICMLMIIKIEAWLCISIMNKDSNVRDMQNDY